jgi:hypothetical protein
MVNERQGPQIKRVFDHLKKENAFNVPRCSPSNALLCELLVLLWLSATAGEGTEAGDLGKGTEMTEQQL